MSSNQQRRSVTGFVTKLVGDGATYGFINDEIFFPQTSVACGPAKVGDQVFAECEYSEHLPIKWNATSVKITCKATAQHQTNSSGLEHQQQQQQQPQQFNRASPMANTYQQHRQQRQILDHKQQDNIAAPQPNTPIEQSTRLLDSAGNQGGEFTMYGANNPRAFQQQQPDKNIQPFQDQPMGPPNLAYTSQLGSAFVQSQFGVPQPFMVQAPMLPQQQPQQQQQTLLPNNQMHNQQNNQQPHQQRQNQNNKGGRFNNQHGEKNDRQNRRNQNRNDNKFDNQQRGGDRDGMQNNRSKNNRDRSVSGNSKRDDTPVRPSPPPRSNASHSSERGSKSRRHYEVHNIPRARIMTNMNAYNMKQRCPSSVHVPSDLKDIIVNEYFRLDIKNMPKPIRFTIESIKKEAPPEEDKAEQPNDSSESGDAVKTDNENEVKMNQDSNNPDQPPELADECKKDESIDSKPKEQPTPPPSKSDMKLNHKYCVKVILLSLPELESIYQTVFGENLESFENNGKRSRLDETISLLCNKGSNNGYSLIGGKFDPILDGFIEGETFEYEKHGKKPDLIAACKRIVLDQTGLDLAACRTWTLLSTFMYNNKSDYFSPKASIEYSYIYLPQIWTILSDRFDHSLSNRELITNENEREPENPQESSLESEEQIKMETESCPTDVVDSAVQEEPKIEPTPTTLTESVVSLENLSELKVVDLKAELEKRNVIYKGAPKKAELVALLEESIRAEQKLSHPEGDGETVSDLPVQEEIKNFAEQPGEEEKNEASATNAEEKPADETVAPDDNLDAVSAVCKRKLPDETETDDPSTKKKICVVESPVKGQRVELIRDSFVVRARDDQQQLSLVSLYESCQASRHDQFELSVASNLLKESLTQHLSEYILTTLIEDNRQKLPAVSGSTETPSASSSQETSSSDTNNNTPKTNFKNPTSAAVEPKVNLKELPVNRYINLAFTYFDSSHMGYLYFEDLNKLFNNSGLTISKRALISLVGDGEKFNYRTLPDLSPKLPPNYTYAFPDQFRRVPGFSSPVGSDTSNVKTCSTMIEHKGVAYDIEKLVQQVNEAEMLRVSLVDRFNYAIENFDKQTEEIHVLEVSQKSLAKAIKAQNDEICDLKRERDSIKKKHDTLRKGVEKAATSLSDLVKEDK